MKKYIIACMGLASLTATISSCKKITDLSPISSVSERQYWQNPSQVQAFVTGIHIRLRGHNGALMNLGELRSGTFGTDPGQSSSFLGQASQGLEVMWNQTLDQNNPGVTNYGGFYENINQINLLISKIPTVPGMNPDDAKAYLGMAYGLRAFYYFQLYKYWGNAIIATDAYAKFDISKLAKAPSPAEEVLKQVKADIDESNTQFASYAFKPDYGYWSKAATQMLKAEVYLWTAHRTGGVADANTAKAALTDIQTNAANFSLQPNYSDVFTLKANSEMIFASKYVLNEANMDFISATFTAYSPTLITFYKADGTKFDANKDNWNGTLRAPTRIATYNKFMANDKRRDWTITAGYNKDATGALNMAGCFLSKFPGVQNAGVRAYVNDYPIYRYSDLLLLLAEAKAITGEDFSAEINQVRQRAFGKDYNAATMAYPNMVGDNAADKNNVILNERLFEFIGEGKRWSDLRRFGDNYVFGNTNLTSDKAFKLLWPVDLISLTNNRLLKQTPGY